MNPMYGHPQHQPRHGVMTPTIMSPFSSTLCDRPVYNDQDQYPSCDEFGCIVEEYLRNLSSKKRDKALVDQRRYALILQVLKDPRNTAISTAQFRFWVKKMFQLGDMEIVFHDNKPVAMREQIYDILVKAHREAHHGGRDKTSALVRRRFSWIPKELIARFVRHCPFCISRRNGSPSPPLLLPKTPPASHYSNSNVIPVASGDEGMDEFGMDAKWQAPSCYYPSLPPTSSSSSTAASSASFYYAQPPFYLAEGFGIQRDFDDYPPSSTTSCCSSTLYTSPPPPPPQLMQQQSPSSSSSTTASSASDYYMHPASVHYVDFMDKSATAFPCYHPHTSPSSPSSQCSSPTPSTMPPASHLLHDPYQQQHPQQQQQQQQQPHPKPQPQHYEHPQQQTQQQQTHTQQHQVQPLNLLSHQQRLF